VASVVAFPESARSESQAESQEEAWAAAGLRAAPAPPDPEVEADAPDAQPPPSAMSHRLFVEMRGGGSWSGARSAEAGASAGGELSLASAGANCQPLALSGSLHARGDGFGVAQAGELCLASWLPAGRVRLFGFAVRESARWNVRTRLNAPLRFAAGPYSSFSFGVTATAFDHRGAEVPRRTQVFGLSQEMGWTWQALGGDPAPIATVRGEFWAYRRSIPHLDPTELDGEVLEILVIGGDGVRDGDGAAVVEILPVRWSGIPLLGERRPPPDIDRSSARGLYLDVAAGLAGTGSTGGAISIGDTPVVEETIETTRLPQVTAGILRAKLRLGLPWGQAGLAAGRTLQPTLTAHLALEDRLSGSLQWSGGRASMQLSGFAARNIVWLDERRKIRPNTWGVSKTTSIDLPWVRLGIELDVGRSFYARRWREPAAAPHVRLRANASWSWTAMKRRPRDRPAAAERPALDPPAPRGDHP
jgi:hypothetical protein